MATSIIIFEDNDILRESISSMLTLDSRFMLVGAFSNALSVEEKIKEHKPDLVLMDIDMPGRTGIEAVKIIRAFDQQLLILMLTVFDDNKNILEAIQAGASGYLLKKDISGKLFVAIEEILNGGAPMSPSVARMVIASLQPPAVAKNSYQLTPREKEILASMSKGNSYKMVAAAMAISIDTVRAHIKNIYEKLHVHSQSEAVIKAINEKLV
jgi:DNA-binding NarL/FixJ family response regulator